MNEQAKLMRPDAITIDLGDTTYTLKYDLNAFCEMEKMYDSVDSVLQMLLGVSDIPDMAQVRYKADLVNSDEVTIAGVPLTSYIAKINNRKEAKHIDTRNLLWTGVIHKYAVYDDDGEISGYTISKAQLGSQVTFQNLREVNAKIVTAILRDLLPPAETKNEEAPERLTLVNKTEA